MHAHLPAAAWAALLARCTRLATVDLTHCQGLTDAALGEVLALHPLALARLRSLVVRGSHRGDVALTEASVARLAERCPAMVLGDTYAWTLRGPEVRLVQGAPGGSRGL